MSMSKISIRKKRVVVGMSGGVDSSITAWLLKEKGYEVIGLFMKNWNDDNHHDKHYCSVRQDFLDAASVADLIGIEFDYVDFSAEYKEKVFDDFLNEYSIGRTPNPDILCNSEIKFKAFMNHALRMGVEFIATGHYARIKNNSGDSYQLLKAFDQSKDQSYFLYRLNQHQLARTIFPLGKIPKIQVRRFAHEIGLHNANKKDSTGICFIGERPFKQFIKQYLPEKPGPILTLNGDKIGHHNGLHLYTIGQRRGLGIGGSSTKNKSTDNTENNAWYVCGKNIKKNVLFVVQGRNHPYLFSKFLHARNASWIKNHPPLPGKYFAKIRYRQQDITCDLIKVSKDEFQIKFLKKQWAITPGQSVVIYNGDICLGGGIIYEE